MDEHQIRPEEAVSKPWWEGKQFKKVAFIIGVPLLLYILFHSTAPVPVPAVKPVYPVQNTAIVNPQQVSEAEKQAQQIADQMEKKKEQLLKTEQATAAALGVKTDDLDLSTPEGESELRARIALAQSLNPNGRAPVPANYNQPEAGRGSTGSGQSRSEKMRQALLASAVVYVSNPQNQVAPQQEQRPVNPPQYPAVQVDPSTPNPEEKAGKEAAKKRSLLDLPADVVSQLRQEQDYRVIPQGTVVESVLTNKLVGDAAGPVNVMITTPVYATGSHDILLPPGTRLLGEAESVGAFGDSRLAVVFHRAIITNGMLQYSLSLDTMPGLDQQGAVGLTGKVDQHILSTIAISGVIGAIGGLANIGNYSGNIGTYGAMQQFQSGISQSMGQSAMQVLNRFINRRPTVEIQPGTRVKLIWAGDQSLPIYSDVIQTLKEKRDVAQF